MSGTAKILYRIASAAVLLALPLIFLAGIGGCLVATSSNETHNGKYISPSSWDQIQPGKTSQDWVTATLGDPTTKTRIDSDGEVWKYSYKIHKDSSGAVFLIFAGSSSQDIDGSAFIEFKDHVVTRRWRDEQSS